MRAMSTGSQALVAFSLQKVLPDAKFSMVAEEDSTDLRQARKHMTARPTHNTWIALLGASGIQSYEGRHCLASICSTCMQHCYIRP